MGKQTDLFDDREDIDPPSNIVEYLTQPEPYPEDNAEPEIQTPETREGYSKAELDNTEDKRLANMKTVIKRFDDIENKLNQILDYKECRECGGKVIK